MQKTYDVRHRAMRGVEHANLHQQVAEFAPVESGSNPVEFRGRTSPGGARKVWHQALDERNIEPREMSDSEVGIGQPAFEPI